MASIHVKRSVSKFESKPSARPDRIFGVSMTGNRVSCHALTSSSNHRDQTCSTELSLDSSSSLSAQATSIIRVGAGEDGSSWAPAPAVTV